MQKLLAFCLIFMVAFLQAESGKADRNSANSALTMKTSWGPDAFGYVGLDSNEPNGPPVEWIDISSIGTLVTGLGDDNIVGTFDIGFPFRYYWYEVNSFAVGSNGYIRFSGGGQLSDPFTNIPNALPPNDILCPFTTDLDPSTAGSVYYWSNNIDTLIVSFNNMAAWLSTGSTGDHNFQIVLSMVDTSITFNIGPQSGAFNNLNGMSGIENSTGEIGILTYSNNTIPANYSMKFYYPASTTFEVHDMGIAQVENPDNGGFFVRTGDSYQASGIIKNFGNQGEADFYAVAEVRTYPANVLVFSDSILVDTLAPGASLDVLFPDVWTMDTPGSHIIRLKTTLVGDLVTSNDQKDVKLNVVDLPGELSFDDGLQDQLWSWNGGNGGMGVYYAPPSYPVKVTELNAYLGVGTDAVFIELYDDDGVDGQPGTLLVSENVTAATEGWYSVSIADSNISVDDGGVYIAWRQNSTASSAVGMDNSLLGARRTFEFTGVWAVFRNTETSDAMLRISVEQEDVVVFSDNFDSGLGNWTGDWGLATNLSNSPPNSFTDSPGGNYPASSTLIGELANGVDLSGYFGAKLEFVTRYEIETGFDYCYLEASTDGGATWLNLKTYNGEGVVTTFTQETIDIGAFAGASDFRIRFRMVTDGGYEVDGMYVDDLTITGLSTDVSPPLLVFDPPVHFEGVVDTFNIDVTITDTSGVADATINYWTDGTPTSAAASTVNGDVYTFSIPPQDHGSTVYFTFSASDNAVPSNAVTSDTAAYVAGEHQIFDDGEPEFITTLAAGTSAAVRFDAPSGDLPTVAAVLLRIYTDTNNPTDSVTFHIWSDANGLPSTDLITPFKIFPQATLQNPQGWTVVDISDLALEPGAAYWAGYENTSAISIVHLYDQPAVNNRTYTGSLGAWAPFAGDFHLRAVHGSAMTDIGDPVNGLVPEVYALSQNYPNPFNPTTNIKFALPERSSVTLEVYNALGQRVATLVNGSYAIGVHEVTWQASSMASGIYFYRLNAESISSDQRFNKVGKMILMK